MHVVLNAIVEERKRRDGGLDHNRRIYCDVEAARDSQDQSCDHMQRVDVIFQVTSVDLLR